MSFNIDAAKKAGYSQAEINDFLAGQKKFDVESAKGHGYSDEEIYDFLSQPEQKEEKEPLSTEISRTAAQLPLGALEGTPYGIATNLWQMMGLGESLSELDELEERLPDLKKKFPHLDWPEKIDREKYMKSVEEAVSSVPSIQNLAKYAEENTGLPLQAKTDLQKGINFFSSLAGFGGGSIPERFMTGFKGEIMKEALQHAGIPEPISEAMSIYHALHEKTPKINVQKAGKEVEGAAKELAEGKGPSVEPAEIIEPETKALSKASLEEDFRDVSDKLFSENRTYSAIKEDPGFKNKISDLFEEVEKLAAGMEETVSLNELEDQLVKRFRDRKKLGITDSEQEKTFKKELGNILKGIRKRSIVNPDSLVTELLEQYRKNSQELARHFEPGKSAAFNQGKRDALLEYNNAIQDVFEKLMPESDFTKLFKFSNKRWQEIKDVEAIDKWFQDVFDKKVNFNQARKLLLKEKENLRRPFKRMLGAEGFKDFEDLLKQFVAFEEPYTILKKAQEQGYAELARLAKELVLDPRLSKLGLIGSFAKKAFKIIMNKPHVARVWKEAIKDLKSGNFDKAQAEFKQVENAVKMSSEI